MADELATALWTASRRDLLTLFGYIENADVRYAPGGLLGLAGGPTADFNMALIDAAAGDETLLGEFVDRVTHEGLPTVFMLSGACAARLGPVAKERGLVEAGIAPLMVLEDRPVPRGEPGFAVQQVSDRKSVGAVADLVSAAFALDRQWVRRTFCADALLDAPSLSFFLASKDGEPCSAVTTTAGRGTVGIWSMATAPEPSARERAAPRSSPPPSITADWAPGPSI